MIEEKLEQPVVLLDIKRAPLGGVCPFDHHAAAMADDKLGQAEATEADALVTGDSGCLMHLAGRMGRTGSPLRPLHLAVILAEARGLMRAARPAPGPPGYG